MRNRLPLIVDPIPSRNLRKVSNLGIYVGAVDAIKSMPERPSLIVDLYGESCKLVTGDEPVLLEGRTTLLCWPVWDGVPIPDKVYDRVVELARKKIRAGPVLVHCQAGLSRSASVAYALIRTLEGLSHDDALRRVQIPGKPHWPSPKTIESARKWYASRRARFS